MSQSPPNYMDGVPVKISERFRPPPKITLPQSVTNRLTQLNSGGASRTSHCYDFKLEETVLKRITEWRGLKEKERYERSERVRLKEQELTRLVEEEQKRKLNQISYPNTDDLSSASEDGDDEPSEENDDSVPSGSSEEQSRRIGTSEVVSETGPKHGSIIMYDKILLPTVLPEIPVSNTSTSGKLITDMNTTVNNIPNSTSVLNNNNNGYNKINYSDFENDTSSPFDNMELKTINDLDILAQVLNLNVSNSGLEPSPDDSNITKANSTEVSINAKTKNQSSEIPVEKNLAPQVQHQFGYTQQSQQYQPATYQMSQQNPTNDYYESFNSYHYNYCQYAPTATTSTNCYTPTDSAPLGQYNSAANTLFQPGAQSQYQPFSQGHIGTSVAYSYYPYSSSTSNSTTQSTYAQNYLYNNAYAHQPSLLSSGSSYNYAGQSTPSTTVTSQTFYGTTLANSQAEGSTTIRSKSKSVPDIVRQLEEEIQDSAMKRTRNNSQSNAEKRQDDGLMASKTPAETPKKQDFTFFNQLSPTEQNMVERISSMGFPLERVAAVLKRIGNDDKKIIEHLIPLSELLDLGFEEERISDALIRCGNNKHHALDDLLKS